MKKRGILNAELMRCIASLGHKDLFMIGDAGMPIPEGVKVIDLAVCSGVPLFNSNWRIFAICQCNFKSRGCILKRNRWRIAG